MVHLLVVVAVVGRLLLIAVYLDRQAIDVEGDLAQATAAVHRPPPTRGQLGDCLLQHAAVGRLGQKPQQARQRRLRRQVLAVADRQRAGGIRDRQPQRRIEAQRIGVVLVAPALAEHHHYRMQQLRQRIVNLVLHTWIGELPRDLLNDAALVEQLPHQHRTTLGAEAVGARLDVQPRIEGRNKNRRCFTHRVRLLGSAGITATH